MKNIFIVLSMGLLPFVSLAQKKNSLHFTGTKLSPSQYIYQEFSKECIKNSQANDVVILDTICVYAFCSIRFTVNPTGKVTNIEPSVGLPKRLITPLKKSIKNSEGHWVNTRKRSMNCILPIMIFPSSMCQKDTFLMLQSGSQMLKYSGEYVIFFNSNYNDYNIDMDEGVIISPIMLQSGRIRN